MFVIVGGNSVILTSIDGINWSNEVTQEFSENGSIYARLTDGNNTSEIATDNVTNIDKVAPVIVSLDVTKSSIKAYVTDDMSGIVGSVIHPEMGGWATSGIEPTLELIDDRTSNIKSGTRYICEFEDAAGNTTGKLVVITPTENEIQTLNLSDWEYKIDQQNKYITLTKYIGSNTNLKLGKLYIVNDEILYGTIC
jgi:hypothetical protein